jgi:hypothetical protein
MQPLSLLERLNIDGCQLALQPLTIGLERRVCELGPQNTLIDDGPWRLSGDGERRSIESCCAFFDLSPCLSTSEFFLSETPD